MKPLNAETKGCDPMSSNCVIWQGPDIECIKLCKGDSVSDVVYNLATELCKIMDIMKISSYDLSCFNLTTCGPKDFQSLIQFILTRLCKIQDCAGLTFSCDECTPAATGGGGTRSVTTSSTIINIAPCFYYTNQFGDTVTTMPLGDYVIAIGNKICDIVTQITSIQNSITNLNERVTILENEPAPVFQLPDIIPACVLPASPTPLDQVVIALEQQFCDLRTATGLPNPIYQNIVKQCAGLNTAVPLSGIGGTMASIPGWASTVLNLAQAFGNMWLTICDMRNAIANIQANCCPSGCSGNELSLTATMSGSVLNIFVNGTITPGFSQCTGSTSITITDSNGNSVNTTMDLIGYLNNISGFPVNLASTPINTALDLTIVITPCLRDGATDTTCESILTYTVINNPLCPSLVLTALETSISYSFISASGSYTYVVQLWDNAGAVMLSSNTAVTSGVSTVTGTFSALTAGTTYMIRISVVATACMECTPSLCPFNIVSTTPAPCYPPVSVSAAINIII